MFKFLLAMLAVFSWYFYTADDRDIDKNNRYIRDTIRTNVNKAKAEVKRVMSNEEKKNEDGLW